MRNSIALSGLMMMWCTACSSDADAVMVELSPDVISSLEGTLNVHATALADRTPVADEALQITVEYTDRNGAPHEIAPVDVLTTSTGAGDAELSGLTWDGTGTVTVTIPGTTVTAAATFAVLDRTPPVLSITPPANNQVHVGADVTISVHVQDEIGISQVFFEADNRTDTRDRSTVVASGATDTSVSFDMKVSDAAQVGSMITLYALAADLSGNQAAADPVTVPVAP